MTNYQWMLPCLDLSGVISDYLNYNYVHCPVRETLTKDNLNIDTFTGNEFSGALVFIRR